MGADFEYHTTTLRDLQSNSFIGVEERKECNIDFICVEALIDKLKMIAWILFLFLLYYGWLLEYDMAVSTIRPW